MNNIYNIKDALLKFFFNKSGLIFPFFYLCSLCNEKKRSLQNDVNMMS